MKQSCVLILTFHLVLIFQYAASETYKEWYENTVRNCTAGSTVKYYKPNMMCTCSQPGVIDYCHYLGLGDNSAIELRGLARTTRGEWKPKHPCSTLALPIFDGCNWCGCDNGGHTCTQNPCLKKLKGSTQVFIGSGTLNINTFGPEKCPAKRYQHEDGCNWCSCNSGWVFCTVMRCPEKKQEVNKCVNNPNGGFYADDGCNWCTCTSDNTVLCTIKQCIKEEQSIEDMCTKNNGVRGFSSDDGCNWCSCTPDNKDVICTRMACKGMRGKKTLIRDKCKKNPKGLYLHDDGCNWCVCTRDKSNAICTNKPCNREGNKKPEKSRNPCKGKWFGRVLMPDGCNTCGCLFGQSTLCTIMNCPKPEEAPKKSRNPCKGKWFGRVLLPDGCNTCACRFGQATGCTIMNCPEPVVTLPKKLSSSVCKNGSRHVKPDECNVCLCDNRGVAVCTLKYCPGKKTKLAKKKPKHEYTLLQGKQHGPSTHKVKLIGMKERAQKCKVGEKFKKPYTTCTLCTCIEDGVVICNEEGCR